MGQKVKEICHKTNKIRISHNTPLHLFRSLFPPSFTALSQHTLSPFHSIFPSLNLTSLLPAHPHIHTHTPTHTKPTHTPTHALSATLIHFRSIHFFPLRTKPFSKGQIKGHQVLLLFSQRFTFLIVTKEVIFIDRSFEQRKQKKGFFLLFLLLPLLSLQPINFSDFSRKDSSFWISQYFSVSCLLCLERK